MAVSFKEVQALALENHNVVDIVERYIDEKLRDPNFVALATKHLEFGLQIKISGDGELPYEVQSELVKRYTEAGFRPIFFTDNQHGDLGYYVTERWYLYLNQPHPANSPVK